MVNKKNRNTAKAILCILLCVLFAFQSFALPSGDSGAYIYKFDEKYKDYYAVAYIEDDIAKLIGEIDPTIDDLLNKYVQLSLYDLTREQAITSMLRKFLINNAGMIPELGDALLTAFDDFGGYFQSVSTQELFANEYKGFGILLDGKNMSDGVKYNTVIKQVFDDSPASNAGLKPGDEIIKVGKINVEGLGTIAVGDLLLTYTGKVSLTVKRNGKTIDVSMDRGIVHIQSVSYSFDKKTKTAMLKIDDFTDEYMLYDLYDFFEYVKDNEYRKVIIDLRDNLGGEIMKMLETLNMFTPEKGVVLCSVKFKDGDPEKIKSSGDGLVFDKLCVLTNNRTASASELFALSLREFAGAAVIGEKTYGKGVGQLYFSLPNGDAAAITMFELLTTKGTSYHKKGVEPDIKIAPDYIKVKNNSFGQLNFVSCLNIKKDAENNAVLALNQRLARIGYISPEDITGKCTAKTITAVEIFQKYNSLPVGISKIDYRFLDYLNRYMIYSQSQYAETDVQSECANIYMSKNMQAAEEYAGEIAAKTEAAKVKK